MRAIDLNESTTPYSGTLYHGTTAEFDEFDFDLIKSSGPYGNGVYLSNDLGLARVYSDGGKPLRVRVVLKRPYWLNSADPDYMEAKRPFRSREGKQALLDSGYDGVVLRDGSYVEVVAYRGAQLTIIKTK